MMKTGVGWDKEQEYGIRGTQAAAVTGKTEEMPGRMLSSFAVSHCWASETANVGTEKQI